MEKLSNETKTIKIAFKIISILTDFIYHIFFFHAFSHDFIVYNNVKHFSLCTYLMICFAKIERAIIQQFSHIAINTLCSTYKVGLFIQYSPMYV